MVVSNELRISELPTEGVELGAFEQAGQEAFARLSRDFNPVHLDPVAARRTLFGQPIVHGMHLVLRALETVSGLLPSVAYARIVARFHRPVFLGERLFLQVRPTENGLDLAYVSDGTQLTTISLTGQRPEFGDPDWSMAVDHCRTSPRESSIEEMQGYQGVVGLPQNPAEIRACFPAASQTYGTNRIANLLGITYAIGMEVPGLHSMFATLSVNLLDGVGSDLQFLAKRVTPKLSHVQLQFQSEALSGSSETFVRPRVGAIDFETCRKAVVDGEFRGRCALIVGGSRGLGLLTANLLGAGGAEVVITYRSGEEEAKAAIAVMRENGVAASAIRLDVASSAEAFAGLGSDGISVTDMFYFATPHIFVRKKRLFEDHLLNGFVSNYTTNFLGIVEETKRLAKGGLAVFYPSSDALNNPLKDLAEYYVAKMAGEAVCEMLNRYDDEVNVTVSRLPRLPTDQTATLMNVATDDPVAVLLDICRTMKSRRPDLPNTP